MIESLEKAAPHCKHLKCELEKLERSHSKIPSGFEALGDGFIVDQTSRIDVRVREKLSLLQCFSLAAEIEILAFKVEDESARNTLILQSGLVRDFLESEQALRSSKIQVLKDLYGEDADKALFFLMHSDKIDGFTQVKVPSYLPSELKGKDLFTKNRQAYLNFLEKRTPGKVDPIELFNKRFEKVMEIHEEIHPYLERELSSSEKSDLEKLEGDKERLNFILSYNLAKDPTDFKSELKKAEEEIGSLKKVTPSVNRTTTGFNRLKKSSMESYKKAKRKLKKQKSSL